MLVLLEKYQGYVIQIIVPLVIWFTMIRSDLSAAINDIDDMKKTRNEVIIKIYSELVTIKEDIAKIKGAMEYERDRNHR